MPSTASPRTPRRICGFVESSYGVPTGIADAPAITFSPSSLPYGEPCTMRTPSPMR